MVFQRHEPRVPALASEEMAFTIAVLGSVRLVLEVLSRDHSSEAAITFESQMRDTKSGRLVGTVQATDEGVARIDAHATLAWVVGVPFQRCGYATETTRSVLTWLRGEGIVEASAFIHPAHVASAATARKLGLRRSSEIVGGEYRWTDRATPVFGAHCQT